MHLKAYIFLFLAQKYHSFVRLKSITALSAFIIECKNHEFNNSII